MLEIIGIILLCKVNSKNAVARGQRPGKYIAFTLLLWLGLELVGGLIGGLAQMGFGAYLLALAFAGVGGFLSYRLAKGDVSEAGAYVQPGPWQPAPAYGQPSAAPLVPPAPVSCADCGRQVPAGAKFCQACGASLAPAPPAETAPRVEKTPAVPRDRLVAAARAVFNNPYSSLGYDPADKEWRKPVQAEIDLLVQDGEDSLSVLEELLMQCADGGGAGIAQSWWYGSEWAVKTAAMLPQRGAAALMVRLLQKNSSVFEWFQHVQGAAAAQLGKIGGPEEVAALKALLEKPFPMSPVDIIAKAVEQLEGGAPQTPAVILSKAQNQLGDADGIGFLLPFMDQAGGWETDKQGFYYYLLARKSDRMGFSAAARAYYAAQINARPDSTSYGWQVFQSEGVTPSAEAAARLHAQYPVPKTMEEVKKYASMAILSEPPASAAPTPKPKGPKAPEEMTADELIDYMAADGGVRADLGVLGMKLSGKLKAGFYDRPQDIEKALRTFGDESMVARFNRVKGTMQPEDLGVLLPDLLTRYVENQK